MRTRWAVPVAVLLGGLCFAFPYYLVVRERALRIVPAAREPGAASVGASTGVAVAPVVHGRHARRRLRGRASA